MFLFEAANLIDLQVIISLMSVNKS